MVAVRNIARVPATPREATIEHASQRADKYRGASTTTPRGMYNAPAHPTSSARASASSTSSVNTRPGHRARVSAVVKHVAPSSSSSSSLNASMSATRRALNARRKSTPCLADRAGRTIPGARATASFRRSPVFLPTLSRQPPSASSHRAFNTTSSASSAFTAREIKRFAAATPSRPRQIIFPRGVYGCNNPAATPDAPPAMPRASMSVTSNAVPRALAPSSSSNASATPANPAPTTAVLRGTAFEPPCARHLTSARAPCATARAPCAVMQSHIVPS
mmetsp:Transcript_6351/g.21395  ORF Transcript_6351/g.21395 Transcript_6351/m.21395 type:complete len:276 (+) Transcript_6351:656-1483(+)